MALPTPEERGKAFAEIWWRTGRQTNLVYREGREITARQLMALLVADLVYEVEAMVRADERARAWEDWLSSQRQPPTPES